MYRASTSSSQNLTVFRGTWSLCLLLEQENKERNNWKLRNAKGGRFVMECSLQIPGATWIHTHRGKITSSFLALEFMKFSCIFWRVVERAKRSYCAYFFVRRVENFPQTTYTYIRFCIILKSSRRVVRSLYAHEPPWIFTRENKRTSGRESDRETVLTWGFNVFVKLFFAAAAPDNGEMNGRC